MSKHRYVHYEEAKELLAKAGYRLLKRQDGFLYVEQDKKTLRYKVSGPNEVDFKTMLDEKTDIFWFSLIVNPQIFYLGLGLDNYIKRLKEFSLLLSQLNNLELRIENYNYKRMTELEKNLIQTIRKF